MRPIYQVYVEEQLIDIDPKTIIAITLQAADLASGDLVNRKSSFTNQIKAPATPTNIRIFEFSNNPKSGSTFPYQKKTFKILCNGIQIMEGIVIIKSFDNYFNLNFYSLTKDLFYRIANLYLSDIDFGDSSITWNAAFIDSKRASTSGWCAPVVNYGQIDSTAALDIGTYYLPSVSYKDTLTAILENAGYSISGDFYDNDPIFTKLVILYGRNDFLSTTVKLNEVLSTEILQSDFLRDFLVRFGAFFRIVNNDIEVVTYEQILNDTTVAVDWTNKRVKNKKDIVQYTWSGLSKINNFLYRDIENLTGTNNLNRGNGFLTVSNENIDDNTDIYTSLFDQPNIVNNLLEKIDGAAATVVYGVTCSIWESLPVSFTFDVAPKPMIAFLEAKHSNEDAVIYNGSSRTDYLVARFMPNDDLASPTVRSLSWQRTLFNPNDCGFLTDYYSSIQRLLSGGLISTTHEYLLNDIDINSLDVLTPVFDDGNYYLINKVNNYVSGKTTRVELLKI